MALGTQAELDHILKDSGVAVSYGSAPVQTTYGQLDRDQLQVEEGGEGFRLIDRETTLLIRDGSLTGLKQDQPITVDSVSYRIRTIGTPETDGTRRLTLVLASP